MRWAVLLLALPACDAAPATPTLAVEVILRDRQPGKLDLLTLTRDTIFRLTGANFCATPRVTLAGRPVLGLGGGRDDAYAFRLTDAALQEVTNRLADAECGDEIPLEFTLDCTGQPPPEPATDWAVPRAVVAWPARIGPMAKTTIHAATVPTSRAAGIVLEVADDVPRETFDAAIPDAIGFVRSRFRDGEGRSWLSLHPQPPLPPGGSMTVRVNAGIHGLHTSTGCLDFVGERDITIQVRDEAVPTMELAIRREAGVVVIDGDEMGSRAYRLLERLRDHDGAFGADPVPITISQATPHFELHEAAPSTRRCFTVEVAGVPTLFRSVERCADPP